MSFMGDERFGKYGRLAPKDKADYAFVTHIVHHPSDNGTLAVVLPHGVLFRGAAEGEIRKFLVEERTIWMLLVFPQIFSLAQEYQHV